MKVAGFVEETTVDGLGWRASLYVSGCPHNCPGCHNPETHDFNYGKEYNLQEYLESIKDNSILKGITISGGDPLCVQNIEGVYGFIKEVKEVRPDFNVWCYTGYTFEQLMRRNDNITIKTLNEIDTLVDGPFIKEKKDPTLRFRGSSNQRIIDVKRSLEQNKVINLEL